MYKEIFSIRLKKAREMSGFTQREVAKELGITQPSLAGYETGKVEPNIETIGRLVEFYGISVNWLFGLGIQGKNPNYYEEKKEELKYG